MFRSSMFKMLAVVTMFASTATVQAAPHDGDLIVARTGSNQLAIEFDFSEITKLDPSFFGGWAGNEPGFDHLETNEPAEDLYTLAAGASIRFNIVSIDPAFMLLDGALNVYDAPGEFFTLGGSTLHTHVTWFINSNSPSYNPLQTIWSVVFNLTDTGSTGYSVSENYELQFTNIDLPTPPPVVPEPTALAALALVGPALLARRRRD